MINHTVRPGLDIAVIGMTGRFPGACHIKEFWENLKQGIESICFFSREELEDAIINPDRLKSPNYVKGRGILEDPEYFDASFFGYTAREAEKMDPQMRLFHQCAWHSLEDAGYVPDTYPGAIGLYGGATNNVSWEVINMRTVQGNPSGTLAAFQLSDKDHMNTRISYKLNLTGPSFTMETQCSTSLVAVHLACQGLLSGECDMALAGGVSISLPKKSGYVYQEGMILSPDGHCRAFDAKANGTVFGSGVAIVVLKRVDEALADRDHIYAVIKGTAINNDGSRKAGYTAPSVEGQADVIRSALQVSEVEPEHIDYVETHGTGTTLGDPIEIEALNLAFNTGKKGFCRIGSLKPNVGHLDNAAGVASLIKAILVLKHRLIPPSIHFQSPNPKIDFDNSPFRVNRELTRWNNEKHPLRAGVSSFGIGGTNAHVILEEAPGTEDRGQGQGRGGVSPPGQSREYQLILLSAKTQTALERMTKNLAEYFKNSLLNHGNHENPVNPGLTLADAAYTLQVGRKDFQHRRMLVCSTLREAVTGLSGNGGEKMQTFDTKGRKPPVILMCSPLEPDSSFVYKQMTEELYKEEPQFRKEIDRCFEILYPGNPVKVGEVSGEEQPVIFTFQYALIQLLMHWGIEPREIIGHGLGQITADCLKGELSLQEALHQAETSQYPPGSSPPGPAFTKSIANGLKNPGTLFLETGPAQVLIQYVKKNSGITPEHQLISLLKGTSSGEWDRESQLRHLVTCLGRMWLCGVTPNRALYDGAEKRQRISLPGYSFDMQPYLIDYENIRQSLRQKNKESTGLIKKTEITDWFYTPSWERKFFRLLLEIPTGEIWLIFMDECGVGRMLVQRLKTEAQHPQLITVDAGPAFDKISDDRFVVDPQQSSHYDALFDELKKQGNIPGKILHLWGISREEPVDLMPEYSHRFQQLGFYSLLNVVRSLGKAGIGSPLRLEVVTNNMQEVTGEEKINPLKATIMGAVKVIPLEYPNIRCRSIDILLSPGQDPGTGTPEAGENGTANRLLAELSPEPNGRAVAFRGKHRWEQIVTPTPLEKAKSSSLPCFKHKGVYLVTGGLGGMGHTFAQHLAEHFQASLVLTGRSILSDDERGNRNRQKIRQLEELGAQVVALSADVSQPQQMETVVHRAKEQFGRIDGIIHAAGVADYGGVIQRRSQEVTEQVLAPKVTGTLVLDHLLKKEKIQPDFVVLCSSISAVTAPFGEAAYTAANTFLDAYAHYRNSHHQGQTVSINWGPWQEVGMAVDALKRKAVKQEEADALLTDAISPAQGIDILTRAISSGFPQLAVSAWDLETMIEQAQTQAKAPVKTPRSRPQLPRPELTTPYVAPTDEMEEQLVIIWKDFLGVEKVGIHDNFFELGATSLDIVQVNEKVNQAFNTNILVVDLFENPSISSLVGLLSRGGSEDNDADDLTGRTGQLQEGKQLIQKRLQKRKKDK